MIVITVLAQQRNVGVGINKLCEKFGVNRLTVIRWLAYFREIYPQSAVWLVLRGRFMPPVTDDVIPREIVERLLASRGDPLAGMVRVVSLLSGVFAT